ncbi:nipsnap family protein [Mucor ambiguus]|uniref:Nipsnap family protein n=1 Tax=Mucor ambiguus TaxID=91626 RepID=A0A0C9M6R5_9FUNG|nr:nipsnap family protein [Mucor ambiguus]
MLSRFAQSQRYRLLAASAVRTTAMIPRLIHSQSAISFANKPSYKDDPNRPTIDPSQGAGNEFFENLIYGNKTLRAIEGETHSKMLARGKYVHELQSKSLLSHAWELRRSFVLYGAVHKVKPGKIGEYKALISDHLPKVANDPLNDVHLCGSWSVEIGQQDTFVHIWEYKGYPGHKHTSERLENNPDHVAFMEKLGPLLVSRENDIMLEFDFWQTSPPKVTNGIFELRKYVLKPGRLLEWEMYWRKGLECRRQFCEPVGAWFTQLGELNTVYHMWTYPDLQTRKTTREDAWKSEGWAETVYKTGECSARPHNTLCLTHSTITTSSLGGQYAILHHEAFTL